MVAKPWSVQLEVVEGCNLRCWFCGVHSIRNKTRVWNNMDPERIVRPAFQELNRWMGKVRVELNNHGEPTLHPRFYDVVRIIREECPRAQIQLQTNGWGFIPFINDKEKVNFERSLKAYFAAGGNIIAFNCYVKGAYELAMSECQRLLKESPGAFELIDFYTDNPENQSIYRYYNRNCKKVFVFQDLGLMNVDGTAKQHLAKKILNEAGNSPEKVLKAKLGIDPITEPLQKGCTRVFREITIGWNGVVAACCYDWSNELVFGKFPEESLQEIWEGPYWQAARVLLHPTHGERHMTPCSVCNYNGGFRIGLLKYPDVDWSVEEAYDILLGAEVEYGHLNQKGRRLPG